MRKLTGHANHIYEGGELTFIQVSTIEFDDEHLTSAVVIAHEYNDESLIINSLEQLEQLYAIAKQAFSNLE